MTAEQRRDLLEIVEDRCGRASTLLPSQLSISRWHDVVGEPTLADAILDRIVHHAQRIEFKGARRRVSALKGHAPARARPPLRTTGTSCNPLDQTATTGNACNRRGKLSVRPASSESVAAFDRTR
jgi:hypothetical protein